jgi:hypothetical protein
MALSVLVRGPKYHGVDFERYLLMDMPTWTWISFWHHPLVGHRPKETRAVHQIARIMGVLPLENSEISNKSQRLICA